MNEGVSRSLGNVLACLTYMRGQYANTGHAKPLETKN